MSDNEWHSIVHHFRRAPVAEAALVLAAVGIEHDLTRINGQWHLLVPPDLVDKAWEQLSLYHRENEPKRKAKPTVFIVDSAWPGILGYLLVIWSLPFLEFLFGGDWRSAGAMNAGRVLDGEWWRVVTALTLHADLPHLLGNSAFGALWGWFVGRHLGSGFGWLLVVVSAALGNTLNAFFRTAEFQSIGASTAVFASLSLVAVYIWQRGYLRGYDWRRGFAPVFAAIALLAYTGMGGGNTDIAAHVFGFLCGGLIGYLVAPTHIRFLASSGQLISAVLVIGLIVWCWVLALG